MVFYAAQTILLVGSIIKYLNSPESEWKIKQIIQTYFKISSG